LKAQSGQTSELPDNLSLDDFFSNERQTKESISDAGFDSIAAPAEDRVQSIPEKAAQNQADLRGSDASSGAANQPLARKAPPYHSPQTPGPMKEKNDAVLAKDAAELFHIFLKAAGIEDPNGIPKDKIPELMRTVGTVFRELIDGLMAVLRGRTELKSHLRVSMTTLKPTDNNPLKFSPTVEEALKTFLVNSHPGFIDAVDAVHEGYEDIKNHQLAITAGVQASLVSILNRFEPQHFSEKLKEGVVLQKKAKCWDAYRQAYQQIVEEAMEDFFGDDFVRAYEKQIDRLRTNRK